MKTETAETATVTLGHISAYGIVDRRVNGYTTVRYGEGAMSIMTGREVPRHTSVQATA